MLAAPRPTPRTDRSAPAPTPAPQIRDMAARATGFSVDFDVRTVYDFLFSLAEDAGKTDDLPAAERDWLRTTRESLAEDLRPDLARLFGGQLAIHLGGLVVERADVRTTDALVDAVEAMATPDLLATILRDVAHDPELAPLVERATGGAPDAIEALQAAAPWIAGDIGALLEDPSTAHSRIVAILRTWATAFATIEDRVRAILERDVALRAADRGAYQGAELIERTTGGIRWLPEVGIRRVVLAPSVFNRPFNYLLAGDGWRFFGYPVADDALGAADRLAPPPAMLRLHRALGDETRLRILKLLAGQDLYLTEIAQQLDLSKPTIKHHLALLRSAGLVTVVEAGSVIYYNLRRDRLEAASGELGRFLSD
ncbi:MAG: ArsR/SmtB family transcription factor [Candidatus Limnocylindria bacterium]